MESQDRYDQNRGDMSASVLKYVPPHQIIELTAGMVDPSFVAEPTEPSVHNTDHKTGRRTDHATGQKTDRKTNHKTGYTGHTTHHKIDHKKQKADHRI